VLIGVIVSRQLRQDIDRIADYYQDCSAARMNNRGGPTPRTVSRTSFSRPFRSAANAAELVLGWAHLSARGKLDQEQSVRAIRAIEPVDDP
jgi:hypothetical protein